MHQALEEVQRRLPQDECSRRCKWGDAMGTPPGVTLCVLRVQGAGRGQHQREPGNLHMPEGPRGFKITSEISLRQII